MVKYRIVYLSACIAIITYVFWKHLYKDKEKSKLGSESKSEGVVRNKDEENLKYKYDTVNFWVNNCDQKAGILLAIVGVAITVIMTSDFMKYLRSYIFEPFMQFCSGNLGLSFSWSRFTVFILLIIAAIILITCCVFLFRAISANIDYEKMYKENPDLARTSYIFYGTISQMKYKDFKKGEVEFAEDLKSQIYVNSKIATAKFKNYKMGLEWFKSLLLVSVMLFLAVMFTN